MNNAGRIVKAGIIYQIGNFIECKLIGWKRMIEVFQGADMNILAPPQIRDPFSSSISFTCLLYTAVLEKYRFKAKYRTSEGRVKECDVNPLGMAFMEGQTYLIATLNEHDNPMLLLLHRMLKVTPTDSPPFRQPAFGK